LYWFNPGTLIKHTPFQLANVETGSINTTPTIGTFQETLIEHTPFLRVKGNYLISKTEGRGLFEAMSKCALEQTEVEKIKGNDLVNNTHDFIRKQEVGSV